LLDAYQRANGGIFGIFWKQIDIEEDPNASPDENDQRAYDTNAEGTVQ
jgi:hypothetical protein